MRVCLNCGNPLKEKQKFCQKCGTNSNLHSEDTPNTRPTEEQSAPSSPQIPPIIEEQSAPSSAQMPPSPEANKPEASEKNKSLPFIIGGVAVASLCVGLFFVGNDFDGVQEESDFSDIFSEIQKEPLRTLSQEEYQRHAQDGFHLALVDNQIVLTNYSGSADVVTIPDSVTNIGDRAFYGCTSLTSVTIPDSVTTITSSAFQDCTSLNWVTIPDSVTSVGVGVFSDVPWYKNLTEEFFIVGDGVLLKYNGSGGAVTIPDSVSSIAGSAFSFCSSLTSVTIPDSVSSIGGSAFLFCSSLTSVTIPDSVSSIGDTAFSTTPWYKNLTEEFSIVGDGVLLKYNGSGGAVTIPDSVSSIGGSAFLFCTSLTSVNIPDSVTYIGNSAFRDCSSLTSVNIPDSISSIGDSAFRDCSSLTSVNIPDSVTYIGNSAFENCFALTSATVVAGSVGESDMKKNYPNITLNYN